MNRISLQTANGLNYITVETDGRLWCDRTSVGEYEQFYVEHEDVNGNPLPSGVVTLRSVTTNLFLSALDAKECAARGLPEWSVVSSAYWPDQWEQWRFVKHGPGIALQAWHGKWFSPQQGGGSVVLVNGPEAAGWEMLLPSDFSEFGGGGVNIPSRIIGNLRIANGGFVHDGGPVCPVLLHLGDLLGHALIAGLPSVIPALDFAARYGYHGIRTWTQLHVTTGSWYSGITRYGWDFRSNIPLFYDFIQACADRGLKLHLAAAGTKGLSADEERDIFNKTVDAIYRFGSETFLLMEGINEARDTARDATMPAIEPLVRLYHNIDPDMLVATTSYTGGSESEDRANTNYWTPSWGKLQLVHPFRDGRINDKLRHIFSCGYPGESTPTRRNTWWGEPWGPGRLVSAQGGSEEITDHTMNAGAMMAAMARGAWVTMSGPGVVYEDEPLDAMPGLKTVPAAVARMPQNVAQYGTLGHSGYNNHNRIHTVKPESPDVREDYAINNATGEFLAIRYGPPEQDHNLPLNRPYSNEVVLEEGPWAKVYTGQL